MAHSMGSFKGDDDKEYIDWHVGPDDILRQEIILATYIEWEQERKKIKHDTRHMKVFLAKVMLTMEKILEQNPDIEGRVNVKQLLSEFRNKWRPQSTRRVH